MPAVGWETTDDVDVADAVPVLSTTPADPDPTGATAGADGAAGLDVPSSPPNDATGALSPPPELGTADGLGTVSEPGPVARPLPVLVLYPVPVDVATLELSPLFLTAALFCPQALAARVDTDNATTHNRL